MVAEVLAGSHAALLARQDAEVRLLEATRRCLAGKVKGDREFATALLQAAQLGLKTSAADIELFQDSALLKAWRGLAEGLSEMAREVKAAAERLEGQTLPAIRSLLDARREARRHHAEHQARLSHELQQVSEGVQRRRSEYQKQLESYKTARARFEEHYVKSGRSGPRTAEFRDKCQRTCRRLHVAHNEYVLQLSEAALLRADCKDELQPQLVAAHVTGQKHSLDTWKALLTEVCTSLSAARFAAICERVVAGVAAIDSSREYSIFENVTSEQPADGLNGTKNCNGSADCAGFDARLCEDSSGRLQPDTVAVDNLTVDWMRTKIGKLETGQRDTQQKLKEMESSRAADSNKPEMVCEVASLRCLERRLARQASLLRRPLTELGCEELPAGCDLAIDTVDSTSTVTVNLAATADASSHRVRGPSGRGGLRGLLFSRRGTGGSSSLLSFGGRGKLVSSVSTSTLVTPEARALGSPQPPRRVQEARVSPEPCAEAAEDYLELSGDSCGSCCSETEENCEQTAAARPLMHEDMHDEHEIMHESDEPDPLDEAVGVDGSALTSQEWFHGVLPREEVVRLLRDEGDFLVRETTRNEERQTVLSVCWGGHKHFIVQTTPEGLFRFEGPAFESVPALISHQLQSGQAVTARSGAVLRRAVRRERWELNNDDVILVDKIGRGNFGDVWRARIRGSGEAVAVKTCRVSLPEEQRRKFLQEGRILKQFDHPNVVRLVGIAVQKQPIMIVMELVPGGSLLTFLRNQAANLRCPQLLRMCLDAAAGMRYLESRNCIHRDLAARNCLVGHENAVKISDFGMSREEAEYIVSDGMKQIPIKWTAPEALNFGKYTSLCDVWSFGVLCWEVFARGGTPYPGLTNTKAREQIDTGYRMPAPEGTPAEVYALMLRCWQYEPDKRPHFPEIHDTLFRLCDSTKK